MLVDSTLRISVAQSSSAGRKESNEDSMGAFVPEEPHLLAHKGVAVVIADGVSTADAGREAAELCVKSFLDDYYSTPESWTVETSSRKVLTAINQWLYEKGAAYRDAHRGYVSTFSGLVLKSRTAYVLHVGDTRVYLYREGKLRQLTRDHSVHVGSGQSYLSRAMGFDSKVEADLYRQPLAVGDVFLLSTDGIHDFIPELRLHEMLSQSTDANDEQLLQLCNDLIAEAERHESTDNLTCQLARVEQLPDATADEYLQRLTHLPFPPPLSPGDELDGFEVLETLHESSRSQSYKVREAGHDRLLVMKTPSVNYEDDPAYIERFLLAHWIGQQVRSRHLLRCIEGPANRSCLYSLREYIEGMTLGQWIARHHRRNTPLREVDEVVRIVGQCVRGLIALHRREVLHQDLKPDNIIINEAGDVTIIDYGSCFVAGVEEIATPIVRDKILGTASYSAPEVHTGIRPTASSDLYSLGCITYEMLTGQLPYGENVENARSLGDFEALNYTPASSINPHVPLWMDRAIEAAVRVNLAERYQELTEFIYDLEHPNPDYLAEPPPILARAPDDRFKRLALFLLVTQIITLFLLLAR